jgi:transcriptional regulator of acetoin/glycerol metabolism
MLLLPPLKIVADETDNIYSAVPNLTIPNIIHLLFLKVLVDYTLPGNIRELKNVIEWVSNVYKHETMDSDILKQMREDQRDHGSQAWTMPDESEEIKKALVLAKGKYMEADKFSV